MLSITECCIGVDGVINFHLEKGFKGCDQRMGSESLEFSLTYFEDEFHQDLLSSGLTLYVMLQSVRFQRRCFFSSSNINMFECFYLSRTF